MKYIVDASIIFSGFIFTGRNEYFTTEETLKEVKSSRFRKNLENSIVLMKILEPDNHYLEKIKEISEKTKDIYELSDNDLKLLALSLQENAILLTNDLAMQNVANAIGIKYESFNSKKIEAEIIWKYRCIGCKRIFDRKLEKCPYCGSSLKRIPSARKKI